ncbi:hypothetical protein GGI07_004461 [Coemansia sp. Benny D115]|nr:hypothetical protein GGI07_004461 [Coemansia sp. Benny D115]
MVKFTSAFFLATIFGAFAGSAQPVEALAPRNYVGSNPNVVVVTVTKTVYAKPAPHATRTVQLIPHAAHTTASTAPTVYTTATPSAAVPQVTTSVAAPQTTTESSSSAADWMTDMLNRVNAVRAAAGRSPLSLDTNLNSIAQKHSQYQSSINSMTHSDPAGSLGTRLTADNISWRGAAENIAWNQPDVAAVMSAWINSSGHYANMVGDYTRVGFGVYNRYWTQDFIKA